MMNPVFAVLFLLTSEATALVQNDAKTSPVTKIINMLKDMTVQLQKEQDVDNEAMETMNCWCETYDKEKTQAILDGEDKIAQLKVTSQAEGASVLQRTQEIAALESQLAQAENALASATEQRKKELAEFNEEEKDLLSSIASVKDAIVSLSKHHGASFIQESSGAKDETHKIAVMLQVQLHKHENLFAEVITPHQRKIVAALLQASRSTSLVQSPEDYFAAVASVGVHLPSSMRKFMPSRDLSLVNEVPGGKYYQSASGEIFGILKQMKESFEANLKSSQVQETASNSAFEDLKAAKLAEIDATSASIGEKKQLLGEASFNKAKADQDTEDSEKILAADTEYLAMLKSTCATADSDFALRQSTRIAESAAVSKALAFLNSDDAQDLFHKNFAAVLLQQSKKSQKTRQAAASRALLYASKKLNRPELSALSVKVRIDAFTKAKKQIETLIATLKKETKDEIEKKDICISEINSNEASTEANIRDRDAAIEKIEAQTATIDKLAGEIAELKKQVADSQTALKRASEDREMENHDFQLTIADQRATQKVLTAALNALKGFYDKAALVQKSNNGRQPAGPPPPPAFEPYKAQSGGVMGVIESVIADSKSMEADAIRAEADAQTAYENLTKETNDAVDEMIRSITTKSEFKAQTESDKVETDQSKDGFLATLEDLSAESTALHADCDYTLKNFELRQTARAEEIEALKECLVFLSGGSFKALLQGDDVTPDMQVDDEIKRHNDAYRIKLETSLDEMDA